MAPDRWQDAEAYERYIGRWSRRVADAFVAWLNVPEGAAWVDVGCGTGELSAPDRRPHGRPSRVVGVDPSPDFVAGARERVTDPSRRSRSGAPIALPIDDRAADVVVSGLVLNFVPDVPGALWRRPCG